MNIINKIKDEIIEVFSQQLYNSQYNIVYNKDDNKIIINDFITNPHKEIKKIKTLTSILINQVLEEEDKFNRISMDVDMFFYEKIFNTLSNEQSKNEYFNLFKGFIDLIEVENKLHLLKNNDFINELITHYYHYPDEYSSLFWSIEKLYQTNKQFNITETALDLLIKNNKHPLDILQNQFTLKNIVERDLPQSIEKYRKHWTKVDIDNILPEDVVIEEFSYALSFNKIYLHNLTSPQFDENACLQRIRLLVSCLNKKTISSDLGLKSTVIDSVNASKTHYRIFLSTQNEHFLYKDMIKKIVLHVAGNADIIDEKSVRKVINYELLNIKLENNSATKNKAFKV